MTKIRIYYHVTMINHWYVVTDKIFSAMVESGLYDEAESISIGVLGDKSKLLQFEGLLAFYQKAKVIAHSENTQLFEPFTIQHLKKDADTLPSFYALYLHSKSVTSENEADKKFRDFWADYMLHFMVTDWRKCYHALDLQDFDGNNVGYDACAVRVTPARKSIGHTTHGSGNFHWSNSDYVKTLPKILADDYYDGEKYTGGHIGETYLWSAQPIIYMPCNLFINGFPYQEKTFKQFWEELPNKEKYLL